MLARVPMANGGALDDGVDGADGDVVAAATGGARSRARPRAEPTCREPTEHGDTSPGSVLHLGIVRHRPAPPAAEQAAREAGGQAGDLCSAATSSTSWSRTRAAAAQGRRARRCCPLVRPLLISVHVSPTTPTWTVTRLVEPPSSTSTVWRVPLVVMADVGTASAARALLVTIDTEPVEPFLRFALRVGEADHDQVAGGRRAARRRERPRST